MRLLGMARHPRLVIPELLQHVTHRGCGGQRIFRDDEDRHAYQASTVFHANRLGIFIPGHVQMDNHVHFALFVPTKKSLSEFIQRLHSEHAQRMNAKYGTSGHLFGDRFYSASVDDRPALEVIRYIDLNPVRAGMVARAEDFVFSSARAHALGIPDIVTGELWKPLREIENYAEWLREVAPDHERRLATIRLCTRRSRRITNQLMFGDQLPPR
ncbi:MAG: transposase [Planctomycetes bacterium]|nr:transposase [Planctomycetota bacterium]MCC7170419.1 transposase [Planctomycetota bacterium]